jgi:hypothetical protein
MHTFVALVTRGLCRRVVIGRFAAREKNGITEEGILLQEEHVWSQKDENANTFVALVVAAAYSLKAPQRCTCTFYTVLGTR